MTAIAAALTGVGAALVVGAVTGQLPRLRRHRPDRTGGRLPLLLAQAGLTRIPVRHLAVATVLLAVATGGLTVALTTVPALAVVPTGIVLALPVALLRRRAVVRSRARRRAWPDALAQISSGVRAGRPLTHALVEVSLTGPTPLREPLEGLAARIQTTGVEAALASVRDLAADPVTDRVVEVLTLAHTEGGRIVVEVLDDLAAAVAEEVVAAEEQETLALEGTLNARAVFALPWLVLVAMTAGPGPFRDFYASAAGTVVILIGALVSAVGMMLVARLSRLPVEPRVLAPAPGDGAGS